MTIDTFGNVAIGEADNAFRFNVQGNGNFTGELTAASDARYKQNITPINDALEIVESLKPVSYEYRQGKYPSMNFSRGIRHGLIAQDVEQVLPELVSTSGEEDFRSLNYIDLIPFLIKAIQEQQLRIDALEKELSHE